MQTKQLNVLSTNTRSVPKAKCDILVAWTALLVGIIRAKLVLHNEYRIPSEVISTYIGVLGLLAITKKSKEFYKELHKEQNEK